MSITAERIGQYVSILKKELKLAMGCTEPIAIAYCAAYARSILGKEPERYEVWCSGNIIKNVKAVTVPQTGGLKGIEAATLAGGIGGDPALELEVLTGLTDEHRCKIREAIAAGIVKVHLLESIHSLHMKVHVEADGDSADVEIVDSHTGIGEVLKNGKEISGEKKAVALEEEFAPQLSIAEIIEFAENVDVEDIRETLERQIACNMAISQEGLKNLYGTGIGPMLMEAAGDSLREKAKAAAAAGSDARMNGCPMPVVINSGSGNQGMTVSLPIVTYAKGLDISPERMLRALCVGNLVAIHQKSGIGKLSAFCGATSAAVGAVAGIAWMQEADYETICGLIVNTLGTVGGMVCDGAKSSCAGKIAMALESAFMGYDAAKLGRCYLNGEGLVKGNIEETIASVARMAAKGMRSTDIEILNIMLDN